MRLAVVLAAFAATAGMAYRAFQDELALHRAAAASRQAVDVADRALTTTADLRAALHAYVAPGQGSPFWVSRSAVLIEELQAALTALVPKDSGEPSTVPAAEPMTKLLAADKRARTFVRDNQDLLAADVIFNECRDHLDAIRLQIAAARDTGLAAAAATETALRREQYFLMAAILGAWVLCALLLLPVADAPAAVAARKPEKVHAIPLAAPVLPAPVAPPPVVAKAPPPAPVPRLPEAAQVCADLARASDGEQIAGLLKRASDVLDATGLIVWVASADAKSLVPAASCGYDDRMLARVGDLPLDTENLTAAAFRDRARRTTSAHAGAPAALAIPLVGPTGPLGVLSGEIRHVERVGETTSALAAIFAAQLATLVGSMPAPTEEEPATEPSSQQAQG